MALRICRRWVKHGINEEALTPELGKLCWETPTAELESVILQHRGAAPAPEAAEAAEAEAEAAAPLVPSRLLTKAAPASRRAHLLPEAERLTYTVKHSRKPLWRLVQTIGKQRFSLLSRRDQAQSVFFYSWGCQGKEKHWSISVKAQMEFDQRLYLSGLDSDFAEDI